MVETGHRLDAAAPDGGDELVGFGKIGGQRLFDHEVLARRGGGRADVAMQMIGRGDGDEIDVGPRQQLAIILADEGRVVIGGQRPRRIERQARDAHDLHAAVGAQRRGVVAPHDAGADDADAQPAVAVDGQILSPLQFGIGAQAGTANAAISGTASSSLRV